MSTSMWITTNTLHCLSEAKNCFYSSSLPLVLSGTLGHSPDWNLWTPDPYIFFSTTTHMISDVSMRAQTPKMYPGLWALAR